VSSRKREIYRSCIPFGSIEDAMPDRLAQTSQKHTLRRPCAKTATV
jgi:hypothetical protein